MNQKPISRHPLTWPDGWKRIDASRRKDATFTRHGQRLSVTDGVQRVLLELDRLAVHEADVIISTNVKTRLDGLPRSGEPKPADPGVAVYWQKGNGPMQCMAVDRYTEVADNMAAIAATLEAMRAIERHGGAEILDRAFKGFAALPAPAAGQRDWWTVLDLPQTATADEIRKKHRYLAGLHHPDRSSLGVTAASEERMADINRARDLGLQGHGL